MRAATLPKTFFRQRTRAERAPSKKKGKLRGLPPPSFKLPSLSCRHYGDVSIEFALAKPERSAIPPKGARSKTFLKTSCVLDHPPRHQ